MRAPDRGKTVALVNNDAVGASLGADAKAAFMQWLDAAPDKPPEPLLMKVLAGVGAWVASLFIVAFTLSTMVLDETWGAIVSGVALMAVSIPLLRDEGSVFLRQMALAFALAGNSLVVFGLAIDTERFAAAILAAAITQVAVAAVAWWFVNHSAYRYLAALAGFAFATMWVVEGNHAVIIHLLVAIEVAIAALLFHGGLERRFLPLPYAAATAFLGTLAFNEFTQGSAWFSREAVSDLPIAVIVVAAFAALAGYLQSREQVTRTAAIAIVIVAALLAFLSTPGVLAALLLLASAYALADRVLGVGAAVFMPWFLFNYYHAMDVTLASKSLVLIVSGAILLAGFVLLGRVAAREVRP